MTENLEFFLVNALYNARGTLLKAQRRLEVQDPYVWEVQEIKHTITMIDKTCAKIATEKLGDGSNADEHWISKKRP